MRFALITIKCSALAIGCSGTDHSSALKHELNATSRAPEIDLQECQQEQDDVSRYLRDLASHIFAHNSSVFTGPYSPDKICINFGVFGGPDVVNAHGDAFGRRVTVTGGLIKAASSDADIAGVLAHELAHITMHHITTVHPLVRAHPDYQKIQDRITQLQRRLANLRTTVLELQTKILDLRQEISDAEDKRDELSTDLANLKTLARRDARVAVERGVDQLFQDLGLDPDLFSVPFPFDNGEELDQQLAALEERVAVVKRQLAADEKDPRMVSVRRLRARLVTEREQLARDSAPLHEKLNDLREQERALIDSLVTREESSNWMELEADSVGLEFHLRSQIDHAAFTFISKHGLGPFDLADCEERLNSEDPSSPHF